MLRTAGNAAIILALGLLGAGCGPTVLTPEAAPVAVISPVPGAVVVGHSDGRWGDVERVRDNEIGVTCYVWQVHYYGDTQAGGISCVHDPCPEATPAGGTR